VCLGAGLGWAGCRLWQTPTAAIETGRRGGTVSLSGAYGGMADPMPMMSLFDKQIQLRMGQANMKRWRPDIMPFLTEDDPLGVDESATHRLPLRRGPGGVRHFPAQGRRRGQGHAQAVVMIQP
jgi:threonine dehydrogenase-like Zn-dependent dehydrogenase